MIWNEQREMKFFSISYINCQFILTEIEYKTKMWLKVNEEYLKAKAEKEEKERKEAEEAEKDGKDIKKRIVAGQGKKPR